MNTRAFLVSVLRYLLLKQFITERCAFRPQHLTGMRLIQEMCCGQLSGDQVGSQYVTLLPGMLQGGNYVADIGTAGYVKAGS